VNKCHIIQNFYNKFEIITKLLSSYSYWGWTWVVLRGSEIFLPYFSLKICLLLYFGTAREILQLGVLEGEFLPGYVWEENEIVHNELVRILELEHAPIFLELYKFTLRYVDIIILCIFVVHYMFFTYLVVCWNIDVYKMSHTKCWRNFSIVVVNFM